MPTAPHEHRYEIPVLTQETTRPDGTHPEIHGTTTTAMVTFLACVCGQATRVQFTPPADG